MEPFADVACVLKLNVHCDGCKMKMVEILSSISGVYSVTIDAEEGTAKISGEVDPNILLRALARSGKHAELAWVKLNHPKASRSRNNYTNNPYNNNYGNSSSSLSYGYNNYHAPLDDHHPYRYRSRALPERSWHENSHQHYYPMMRRTTSEYPNYYGSNNNYYYDPLPPARYVPSYPPRTYDPHEDEPIGFCSIM